MTSSSSNCSSTTRRMCACIPKSTSIFRDSQVPLLAVWGSGDGGFGPEGAKAFAEDLPHAQIHLLDGGHFLLETALDEAVVLIHDFLDELSLSK